MIAFSHDSDWLVRGNESGEVQVWSTRVRSEPRTIDTHNEEIRSKRFLPPMGGKWSPHREPRINVTDIVTGQVVSSVNLPQNADDAALNSEASGISRDGSLVAREIIGTKEIPDAIEIWDPTGGNSNT